MGILEILTLISTIVGVIGTVAATTAQNASNTKSVQDTNETNLKIAQETNASNVKQAELAYQRSLPTAQVRNLMSAGMSRAGALSSLTGGGSYTAPTLQSATMQAPQKDFSGIAAAFERLGNAPANMQQISLIQDQRKALEVDTQNKIDANTRANEEHQMNMWRAQYDKDTVTALDASTNKLLNALLDYDGDVSQFKTYEQMVRGLGLQNDTMLRDLPASARASLFNDVKSRFDDARAQQSSEDTHRAAEDKHNIDVIDNLSRQFDLNERKQMLVHKLAILANQVQLSNNEVTQSNYDSLLRDVGFANEREAYEAIRAAENMQAQANKNRSRQQWNASTNFGSDALMQLEWLMDTVNPFKNLIRLGNQ